MTAPFQNQTPMTCDPSPTFWRNAQRVDGLIPSAISYAVAKDRKVTKERDFQLDVIFKAVPGGPQDLTAWMMPV